MLVSRSGLWTLEWEESETVMYGLPWRMRLRGGALHGHLGCLAGDQVEKEVDLRCEEDGRSCVPLEERTLGRDESLH